MEVAIRPIPAGYDAHTLPVTPSSSRLLLATKKRRGDMLIESQIRFRPVIPFQLGSLIGWIFLNYSMHLFGYSDSLLLRLC